MKTMTKTILTVLALGASALIVNAQDFGGPPPDGQQPPPGMGPGNGPQGRPPRRPPPSPLMEALDVNHDGIIDSNEIANASAELKTLDKNGDGKLTPDELRPQRPPRRDGNWGPSGSDNQGPAQGPPQGPPGQSPDGNGPNHPPGPGPDGQGPPQGPPPNN
jgi:hypothetical protein